MKITWNSKYKITLGDFLKKYLKENEKEIFHMLWIGYAIPMKLRSSYFKSLIVGDDKYTLVVKKLKDNTHTIIFYIIN